MKSVGGLAGGKRDKQWTVERKAGKSYEVGEKRITGKKRRQMERKKIGKENGYAEAKRKNTRVRDCGRVSLRSWSTIKRCALTLWWLPSPPFSTLLALLKPSHSRLLPVGYFLRYNVLRLGLSVRCFSSAGLLSTCYPSPYLVHAPCWYTRCILHRARATFLFSPFSSISISLALLVSFLSICPFLSPSPRGYSRYTFSCTQSTNVTAIKTRLRSPDVREGTIGALIGTRPIVEIILWMGKFAWIEKALRSTLLEMFGERVLRIVASSEEKWSEYGKSRVIDRPRIYEFEEFRSVRQDGESPYFCVLGSDWTWFTWFNLCPLGSWITRSTRLLENDLSRIEK